MKCFIVIVYKSQKHFSLYQVNPQYIKLFRAFFLVIFNKLYTFRPKIAFTTKYCKCTFADYTSNEMFHFDSLRLPSSKHCFFKSYIAFFIIRFLNFSSNFKCILYYYMFIIIVISFYEFSIKFHI